MANAMKQEITAKKQANQCMKFLTWGKIQRSFNAELEAG